MAEQALHDVLRVVAFAGSLRRGSFNRAGDPPAVVEFKAAIRAADGVIIATPEYNDGIPGVLTTAIDWGSRPPGIAGSPRLPQRIVKRRLFGQHLMYRGDRNRALAYGRGDSFSAAAADIADREHAGDTGF